MGTGGQPTVLASVRGEAVRGDHHRRRALPAVTSGPQPLAGPSGATSWPRLLPPGLNPLLTSSITCVVSCRMWSAIAGRRVPVHGTVPGASRGVEARGVGPVHAQPPARGVEQRHLQLFAGRHLLQRVRHVLPCTASCVVSCRVVCRAMCAVFDECAVGECFPVLGSPRACTGSCPAASTSWCSTCDHGRWRWWRTWSV